MKKNAIFMFFLLIILALSACNVDENQSGESVEFSKSHRSDEQTLNAESEHSSVPNNKAKVIKVETDLEVKDGWNIVPKGVDSITITAEVENVETVLFWIAPTGTETRLEKKLIGYDIDESDGWSIEWEFGDRIFHDHITVQALGSDFTTQDRETLNIHSVDEIEE